MNGESRRPIETSCYWMAARARKANPPLQGKREADLVVIGAGFTGMWTTNILKEIDPHLSIAVIEQGMAAYGASGRNAGMLGECVDHSHDLAIEHFGRAEAARLATIGMENLDGLVAFLADRGIDCDLERTGQMIVGLDRPQVEGLRRSVECAHELGMRHIRMLDGDETRSEVHCARYQGAMYNPHCGILDPVKLVEGLKREAERQGVACFERSRVTGVRRRGAGVRVSTVDGHIDAQRAVLATNAYTHAILPVLRHRFLPLYDYILVSDPLSAEQQASIGWKGRQSISDARSFFKYYRLTADNRILWGTSEAAYYPPNRVGEACDHSPRHYAELRQSFRRHFPSLGALEFPYAWGGPICSTTRFTPFFGRALGGRVVYGLGYTGHGIGSSRIAGRIMAHMALDRPHELLDLRMVRRKPFPFPPEPLRSLSVRMVTRALRRVDAGGRPGLLLRLLDAMGIGLSS